MHKLSNPRRTLAMGLALALSAAVSVAYAAGDHAGGHASKPGQMDPGMKGMNMKDEGHAAALGQPGDRTKVTRTVTVEMSDTMRFDPARINVKKGETIRFVVKNVGKLKHEMVLGTKKELQEHAAMMRKMPEMEHDDPNQVTVEPGKTGELVWQFTKAGAFDFACLELGHFEAGMVGKINVATK
jgi:uncharacterized cupredoxin-like copper-binding protein